MKKTLLAFLTIGALLLSGCGSNDFDEANATKDGDTNATISLIKTELVHASIDKKDGSFTANIKVKSTCKTEETLSNLTANIGGCAVESGSIKVNPDSLKLKPEDSGQDAIISAKLSDPNCVPTSYSLKGDSEKGGVNSSFQTAEESISSDKVTVSDSATLGIEIVAKKLIANTAGEQHDIVVRVVRGIVGQKGEKVIIKQKPSVGALSPETATSDAAGDAVFSYTTPDPMVDENTSATFCLESDPSMCAEVTISLTTGAKPIPAIDNVNYHITFAPNGHSNNLGLGMRNNALVTLIDKDTQTAIPPERVQSITITSRDITVLKLTPEGGGEPATSVTYTRGRNAVPVLLTADKEHSGLAVLEVEIHYVNLNGVERVRAQLFSIAVLTSAPTGFSITSDGIGYNFSTKQFEHKFLIQANDKSGNNISTPGIITVAAMADFSRDENGKRMFYGLTKKNRDGISAVLTPEGDKAKIEISGIAPFNDKTVDKPRAMVAVFGTIGGGNETYEVSGKWNLTDILSDTTLSLDNQYQGGTHDNLGMAIGYSHRSKFCSEIYAESVVTIDSADGTYVLDTNGTAVVTLKHDPYMVGKNTMIMVNMTGLNPDTGKVLRAGEVHVTTLRSNPGLHGGSIKVAKGVQNFYAGIRGVIDTGTEDRWALVNSTFDCKVELDGVVRVSGPYRNDPDACVSTYLGYYVSAVDENTSGTVTFSDCQVLNESLE